MSDGRKNNDDNLSQEDRIKGGKHSHDQTNNSNPNQDNKKNSSLNKEEGSKSGHTLTDEERARGGRNS